MKKALKSIGWTALYFVLYYLVSIIVGIGVVIIFGVKSVVSGAPSDPTVVQNQIMDMMSKYAQEVTLVVSVLALLSFILVDFLRGKKLFKECNFAKLQLKDILLFSILGISMNLFATGSLFLVNQFINVNDLIPKEIADALNPASKNIFVFFIAVAIIIPVFEEIFFRGILFRELKKGMPFVVALVIQSILFGLLHGNIVQFCTTIIYGIIFGLVYTWRKSIWAPIIVHLTLNSMTFVSGYLFNTEKTSILNITLLIVGFIVCALTILQVYKTKLIDVTDHLENDQDAVMNVENIEG